MTKATARLRKLIECGRSPNAGLLQTAEQVKLERRGLALPSFPDFAEHSENGMPIVARLRMRDADRFEQVCRADPG